MHYVTSTQLGETPNNLTTIGPSNMNGISCGWRKTTMRRVTTGQCCCFSDQQSGPANERATQHHSSRAQSNDQKRLSVPILNFTIENGKSKMF